MCFWQGREKAPLGTDLCGDRSDVDHYRVDPAFYFRHLHGGVFEVWAFGEEGEGRRGGGLCLSGGGWLVLISAERVQKLCTYSIL